MSMLQRFFDWLGFDPIVLSGARADDELMYIIGLVIASALAVRLIVRTPLEKAGKLALIALVVLGVTAQGISMARESLSIAFVEPAAGSGTEGPAKREVRRVAIPMLGLRSSSFPFSLNSQAIDGKTSADYLAESRKPENLLALRATVTVHWALFIVLLTSLIALTGLGFKAMVSARW